MAYGLIVRVLLLRYPLEKQSNLTIQFPWSNRDFERFGHSEVRESGIEMGRGLHFLHPTDCILTQGYALVRAIKALGTIDPSGSFERMMAGLLLTAYKRRLREIVEVVPCRMPLPLIAYLQTGCPVPNVWPSWSGSGFSWLTS